MPAEPAAPTEHAELTRLWVEGWAVSRGTPAPVGTEWGLRVDVGAPNQLLRHVLLDPEEDGVRRLAAGLSEPMTWLKSHVEPSTLGPWLPAGGTEDTPGWIMAADVLPNHVALPDGYRVSTNTENGVTRVRALAADGSEAARGRLGHAGAHGTVDRIATDPAHQRRGLGRVVMHTLGNAAFEAGESLSALGATIEGGALYESPGWKVHAPPAGFIYKR
jgi:GNAT superfamily N-acetyltransferase